VYVAATFYFLDFQKPPILYFINYTSGTMSHLKNPETLTTTINMRDIWGMKWDISPPKCPTINEKRPTYADLFA